MCVQNKICNFAANYESECIFCGHSEVCNDEIVTYRSAQRGRCCADASAIIFSIMTRRKVNDGPKLWDLNEVWQVLTEEEKAYIDENCSIVTFRKNEIIHKEGDVPTHMMMLAKGKLDFGRR